jgi:hypothetical protein
MSQRIANTSSPSQVVADRWVVETIQPVNTNIVSYAANVTAWSAELNCHAGAVTLNSYPSTQNPNSPGCLDLNQSLVIRADGCRASYSPLGDTLKYCLPANTAR